jgi:beta-lactamase class A
LLRRQFLGGVLLAAGIKPADVKQLEQQHGGLLGVAVLDANGRKLLRYRDTDRFPLCSTFKWIAAAAVLERVDRKKETLERVMPYGEKDLQEWAPVTRANVAQGSMKLGELCAAAVEQSDNTAANLVLQALGGPRAVTSFCREHLDKVTRLDRTEPELNHFVEGDPRDTTAPLAMVALLRRVFYEKVLSAESLEKLQGWLVDSKMGADRIPAGLPAGWRAGHKTGTGAMGATNDVAVVWPPNRPPLFIAAYYRGSDEPQEKRSAVLAEVGRLVAQL